MLSKKVKANYLTHKGAYCPYCDTSDIQGGPVEIDSGYCWQEVACNQCGREWQDVYQLVEIVEQ